MQKRNKRMQKFMSPEKKLEFKIASQAGHNKMNDPLSLTNGFIIKTDAVIDNEMKSKFQSLHSDFLSQPKKMW